LLIKKIAGIKDNVRCLHLWQFRLWPSPDVGVMGRDQDKQKGRRHRCGACGP